MNVSSRPCFAFRLFGFSAAARLPVRLLDALFSCCIVRFLSMGIKRKKGSVLEEDMYEVNFIKADAWSRASPSI